MPVASLPAIRIEKSLRDRAAEVDVSWLDLALRSLGSILADRPEQLPDITAARLGEEGLRLQLAPAQPAPAPFITDGKQLDAVFLDFMQYPNPFWHLSISAVSGLRREHRTVVSVEEIGAWVQAGFPAATTVHLNRIVPERRRQRPTLEQDKVGRTGSPTGRRQYTPGGPITGPSSRGHRNEPNQKGNKMNTTDNSRYALSASSASAAPDLYFRLMQQGLRA